MTTHKFMIRRFPEGSVSRHDGKMPHHTDEVLDLVSSSECTFVYSMLQVLWIPRFIQLNPIPQWGFILDNTGASQKTFPILVIEIDGRVASISQDIKEKTALLAQLVEELPLRKPGASSNQGGTTGNEEIYENINPLFF